MKKAVFPGSFDPLTIGHESIIRRAIPLFDEIIIAIGHNVNKEGFFSLEDRKRWIKSVFNDEPKIKIDHFEGLTINYCRKIGANYLLRGLRTSADFEYERAIAQVNKAMHEGIETVFLLTMPEHTPVRSTIIRDIIRHGGDPAKFLPKGMDINDRTK